MTKDKKGAIALCFVALQAARAQTPYDGKLNNMAHEAYDKAHTALQAFVDEIDCEVISRMKRTPPETVDADKVYKIDFDGFEGTIVGSYTTREGREGVVLQQLGNKIVHVYGANHIKGQ